VDWAGIALVITAFGTMFTGLAVLVTAARTERKLAQTNGSLLAVESLTQREIAVLKLRLAEEQGVEFYRRATDPPPPPRPSASPPPLSPPPGV
jgi:hypothetical protein